MKKFYYKKEESIDKTPIILRLERSRTLNQNEGGQSDRQSRYAARATSVSSLDQLRNVPTLPRAKTREVTKSLSEDVLGKTYSTGSTVVITESDLSSSWLYKNMKAAVNSKDENESAIVSESQSSGLSPVRLQDPKMKPVPVVTKGRTRTFSCCCYLAIMVIIAVCTIGFISTIGGIIYLEVFAKNSSTNPTSESPMDALNLLQETQSQDNSTKLNDQRMNQDSSRSLIPIKVNESSETDDQPKIIHILDFGKTVGTELSQYIDNKRTEIRFQKGNAVMYEEKSINSIEYEENTNVAQSSDDQSDKKIGKNNSIESDKSNQSRKNLTDFDQKLDEEIEIVSNPRSDQSPNSISRENVVDHSKEFFSFGEIKDNLEENKTTESTSEAIIVSIATNKLEDSSTDQEKLSEHMNTEINEVLHNVANDLTNPERKADSTKVEDILNEQVPQSAQEQITELEVAKDSQPSEDIHDMNSDQSKDSKEMNIHDINPNQSTTDVESMLSIIDEPVRETKNDQILISKRKGNVIPGFNHAASRTTKLAIMQNGVLPSTSFSQQFQEDEKPQNVELKPSLDIKVSLAAAMKHLQVLDVNNKLLSSRAKSAKAKVTTTQRPPRTNKPRKGETSREKMQYLQKLRLMIYNRLQQ